MKHFGRIAAVVALVAIVSVAVVPLALGAKAQPWVSLKIKPAAITIGEKVTFSGTVKHAVARDTTVKLWLVWGNQWALKKTGTISSTGAFWFTAKGARTGTSSFRVTYRVGTITYQSNKVKVTVTK